MRGRYTPGLVVAAALAIVSAACGSDDADPVVQETTPATTPVTTGAPVSSTATIATVAPSEPLAMGGAVIGDLTMSVADGFTATAIAEGIKPDLALAPDGSPGIAYLVEEIEGFVAYADAATGWTPERVVDGYFYGPIGLAYAPDGAPHIAYHDHQDTSFNQDKGDLTLAVRTGSAWASEAINDDGHDGWDSTIVIGADGVTRAAGIDPEQFGGTDGVEYYEFRDGAWDVTAIGSGPVAYEFNVSLAVDPDGNPALTYYDNNEQNLVYAVRRNGTWSIEVVDSEGDAGRYSSLTFDAAGNPHISYLRFEEPTRGTVRYATLEDGGWTTGDVDRLTDLLPGFTGARRVTAIAVDSDQIPHIVYSDERVVRRAIANAGGWDTSTIASAGDRILGQLTSFRLAEDGIAHIALFEVTRSNPLSGIVAYVTNG